MDARKSNKITEIVKLKQILKKWKKLANASKTNNNNNNNNNNSNKGIKYLKKTLSFSDNSISTTDDQYVPKGYLAVVCVGKQLMKRYVIPTEYLGHQAFGILLREAEQEFGFHQEGVLKIPCEIAVFEMILKMVEEKRDDFFLHELGSFQFHATDMDVSCLTLSGCCSPDCEHLVQSSHPQLCR